MTNIELVKTYISIINSNDWRALKNITIEDLYYKSPIAQFHNQADLIANCSCLNLPFSCETIFIEPISDGLIRCKFTLKIFNDAIIRIPVDQLFTIENNKIIKTVLFYNKSLLPDGFIRLRG